MGYTQGMATATPTSASATTTAPGPGPGAGGRPPEPRNTALRRARLARMRRRATGLLVLAAAAFVALKLWAPEGTAADYALAGVEAAMVGGLADWFAGTALFRHPAGVPIPHTAVIPERKDQFGETLGDFVQTSFLTPDIIAERVRTARVVLRLAGWLADEGNAKRLARHLAEAAVTA